MIKLPYVIFDNAKVLSSNSIGKPWLVFVSITVIGLVDYQPYLLSLFAIVKIIKN